MRLHELLTSLDEGDVVDVDFGRRFQPTVGQMVQKSPYKKISDIEVPVYDPVRARVWHAAISDPKNQEPFDHFVTEPASKVSNATHINGVTKNGRVVRVSTTTKELADTLVDAYNRGGFSRLNIQRVPMTPSNEPLEEDLRQWFREKWVRFGPDGKIRGDCARGSDSEGKPKCLPQAKAHALGKKGRKYAAAKKRREDPNADRSGKAINVPTKSRKVKEDYEQPDTSNVPQYKTWGDAAKAWTDARKSGGIVQNIITSLPGVKQVAGAIDAGAAAVQGDYRGIGKAALGAIPGGKYINTALQAKDVAGNLATGDLKAAGMGALGMAAGQGSKPAADALKTIKTVSNIPKALEISKDVLGGITGQQPTPPAQPTQTTSNDVSEEQLDELKCWPGYSRVRGVPAGAPGSCKKKTNESQHQCPECGGPMFEASMIQEKKDACYYKVKSRYRVWPSAYASGALVKCRKRGAKNWGNKK